jgi:hypothetical protein
MYSLKKFWKLELTSNYNSKVIIELFDITEEYRERLLKAEKFISTMNPNDLVESYEPEEAIGEIELN